MSYVKTINEDGVVSDIMAVALDPTLDATILKNSNLVNGFTQTTAGVNALDAAAGKTLNDSLANLSDSLEDAKNSTMTLLDSVYTWYGTSNKLRIYPGKKLAIFKVNITVGTITTSKWCDIFQVANEALPDENWFWNAFFYSGTAITKTHDCRLLTSGKFGMFLTPSDSDTTFTTWFTYGIK